MYQTQLQTADYWGSEFELTDADIEQIYNHLLEQERPQTIEQIAEVITVHRSREQVNQLRRAMSGSKVYQPQESYEVGEELVFPALKFARGKVTAVRPGYNPQFGNFKVIAVDLKGKPREFATDFSAAHVLNTENGEALLEQVAADLEGSRHQYLATIAEKISTELEKRDDFVRLGSQWFVKSLMVEINIGHLHLAEAVLEVAEGGPTPPEEILPVLDLDPGIDPSVQLFSLNYALLQDGRFDEVAPRGKVAWFLKRLEPEGVRETPARLQYTPVAYDRALLNPQLVLLEQELDDEWSDLSSPSTPQATIFSLTFSHRWAGTLPLSSRTRLLFPPSTSSRQRVIFLDEVADKEMVGWVVQKQRYVYGLAEWYSEHSIPVGGFLHLRPGPEPGVIIIDYDRRRSQREWVRLATVRENRLNFELARRNIACGYDDLLVVGTDVVSAVDAHWRRSMQRPVASLLAEIFPSLASLTPQNAVHAKTLYSAINMLRRLPPGPVFAELVRHPAFKAVGDHYWQFDSSLWQER